MESFQESFRSMFLADLRDSSDAPVFIERVETIYRRLSRDDLDRRGAHCPDVPTSFAHASGGRR